MSVTVSAVETGRSISGAKVPSGRPIRMPIVSKLTLTTRSAIPSPLKSPTTFWPPEGYAGAAWNVPSPRPVRTSSPAAATTPRSAWPSRLKSATAEPNVGGGISPFVAAGIGWPAP